MMYTTTKITLKEYVREMFNNLSSQKREYNVVKIEDSIKFPLTEISNVITTMTSPSVYKQVAKLLPEQMLKNFKNNYDNEEVIKDLISLLRDKGNSEIKIIKIEEKLGDVIVFLSELE